VQGDVQTCVTAMLVLHTRIDFDKAMMTRATRSYLSASVEAWPR